MVVTLLFSLVALAALIPELCLGSSVPLSKDTLEKIGRGKTVLIKFYAPWVSVDLENRPDADMMVVMLL